LLVTATTTATTQKGAHDKSEPIHTFHNLAIACSRQAGFKKPTVHMDHYTTVEVDYKKPTTSSIKYIQGSITAMSTTLFVQET
jgi:hypothetical protein